MITEVLIGTRSEDIDYDSKVGETNSHDVYKVQPFGDIGGMPLDHANRYAAVSKEDGSICTIVTTVDKSILYYGTDGRQMMDEDASRLGFDDSWFEAPDVKIDVDGQMMSIEEFESLEELSVKSNLSLYDMPVRSLPAKLSVGGTLMLTGTLITKLPTGLTVGGDLWVVPLDVTEIPDDTLVHGNLYITASKVTKIGNNVRVGGNVDSNSCMIDASELAKIGKP